jgi:hypothetical protein
MRTGNISEGTLFINNAPFVSCNKNLPSMLPAGSQMKVVVLPGGVTVPYKSKLF